GPATVHRRRRVVPAGRAAGLTAKGSVAAAAATSCGTTVSEGLVGLAGEASQQPGELEGEDELGRGIAPHLLEGVEVLQAHGLGVHAGGRLVDRVEGHGEALGPEDGGSALALG